MQSYNVADAQERFTGCGGPRWGPDLVRGGFREEAVIEYKFKGQV